MIAGAGIAFVSPARRVLLLKRSRDADHPGEWDLPGGLARSNAEQPYGCALREAREEIGETFEDGDASELAVTDLDGVRFTTFRMPVRDEFKPHLNAEHTAFEWRSLDALPNTLHPGTRRALTAAHQAVDARMAMDRAIYPSGRRLAFDRGSVRRTDADGRLHVEMSNISKAAVNGYLGQEIPGAEELGLDLQKTYMLFRDPQELAKAAATFNNIQLLGVHIPVSAADPQKEEIIGASGSDAVFEAPYLRNSLVIWDAAAIRDIESGKKKEISCGYRYTPDMVAGVYEGTAYDGVMREIVGNHIALVPAGRAGSDVVVGDSKLEISMSKMKGLSRKAALAKGALAVYLQPKIAQDAKITKEEGNAVAAVLASVTAKNWPAKKSAIVAAVTKAMTGKLAADADLDDMPGMLDNLDNMDTGPDDNVNGDGPMEKMLSFLEGKLSPEDLAQARALCAVGDADETPEEKAAREAKEKKEGMAGDDPPFTAGTPGAPARPGTGNMEKKMDKAAMDAAIAAAQTATEQATITRMRAITTAENEVRPYVGDIANVPDTAEAVYKIALDHAKIDLTDVHPSAFRSMVRALLPKLAADARTVANLTTTVALDAAGVESFNKQFGLVARPRQLG